MLDERLVKNSHSRFRIYLAIVVLVAVVSAIETSSKGLPASAAVTSSGPTIGAQLLASEIQTLGQESYAAEFAGSQIAQNDVITVYIASMDPVFVQAVSSINTGNYQIDYIKVPMSLTQLLAKMSTLAARIPVLGSIGIHPTELNPDPSTGQVDVTLAKPSATDLANLNATLVMQSGNTTTSNPIDLSNYLSASQTQMSAQFGADIMVESNFGGEMAPTAKSRTNDSSPWTGGDEIFGPNTCTSGFGVTGNASGNTFVLTAGHCGSGFFSVGSGSLIGGTSNGGMYFQNSAGDDFQTISSPNGALGQVWYSSSNVHPINGYLIPSIGAQVTFDGAVTGEVPGNTVTANNATVVMYQNGVYYATINYQVKAGNSTTPICQSGDSGGPIYQREAGTSSVMAVAIINSCLIVPNGVSGLSGSGERIDRILSASNTSLIFG